MTSYDLTPTQLSIVNFGRRMMDLAERGDIDLTIVNALCRVGDQLANTASTDHLTEADKMVIRFAKKLMG